MSGNEDWLDACASVRAPVTQDLQSGSPEAVAVVTCLSGLFQAPGPTKPDPRMHHLPFEEIRLFFSPLLLVPENDLRKKINCITCKQSAQVTFCYSSSLRA